MASHKIVLSPQFKKVFQKKSNGMQAAIMECIQRLGEDLSHPSLRVKKMQGVKDVWEARVDKGNRITFHWDDGDLVLRMNCNHDMLRRNP